MADRRPKPPERPAPPATPPPGTLGTPTEETRPVPERPPLRPMKRNGRRWRANVKASPKARHSTASSGAAPAESDPLSRR